jgi:type II pantothenate kinase
MSDNAAVMNVVGASVSEANYASNETRDIVLPNQNEHVSHIAIDVNSNLLDISYNKTYSSII